MDSNSMLYVWVGILCTLRHPYRFGVIPNMDMSVEIKRVVEGAHLQTTITGSVLDIQSLRCLVDRQVDRLEEAGE